jgi:hypothetical protein
MAGQDSNFYDIIKAAEAEGWTTEKTRKGHWRFNPPDKGPPVFTSGTPGDFRAMLNFLTKLRRRGFHYRKGM